MKNPVLRHSVQAVVVLLLVFLAAVVLGPARRAFDGRIESAKLESIRYVERLLGRRVTYESISPSILRFVRVSGLVVHGRPTEAERLLAVESLRVYYRPLRILQGRFDEAFSEVLVENTELVVDTRIDADLGALLADLLAARSDAEASSALPRDLVLSGRNLSLSLRTAFGRLEMERVFFTTGLSDQVVSVRSQGAVRLSETPPDFPLRSVSGRIQASGTINVTTGEALLEVALAELQSDLLTVRRQVLQLRYAQGTLEARNVQSRDPVDIYVRYRDGPGDLYARVLADGYRLADLMEFSGQYGFLNEYLRLSLSGQVSATLSADALAFGGSLLTRLPGFGELPAGELTVRFDGTPERVRVDELNYATELGSARFSGSVLLDPLRPTGTLTLRNLVYGGIEPLSLTASIASSGNTVNLRTNEFHYAGQRIERVSGAVTLSETPVGEILVELGPGNRRIEAYTRHAADGSLESARVDARNVEPKALARLQQALHPALVLPDLSFLPPDLVVDARMSVDLTDGVVVDVPLFYAFDAANRTDHVAASLTYDNGRLAVRDLTASYAGYAGAGNLRAEFASGGGVTFSSEVEVEGIPYRFTGRLAPDRSLEIRGLHDVDGRFYFGDRGELIFSVRADIPVPLRDGVDSALAVDATGFYFSETDWGVTLRDLRARGIPVGPAGPGRVSLAGTLTPAGARLTRLSYADSVSELDGSGRIAWDIAQLTGSAQLALEGPVAMSEGPAARELYTISAGYDGAEVRLDASVAMLPLTRFGIETLRGAVTGTLSASGPPDGLSVDLTARLEEGRFNSDPIELSGTLRFDPQRLEFADVNARYLRSTAESVSALLSFEDGSASASGRFTQTVDNGLPVSLGLELLGQFSELGAVRDLPTARFTGDALLTGLPVREDLPADWLFSLERSGGQTRVRGGPDDAVRVTITDAGAFSGSAAGPLPVHFDAIGLVEGGNLEADLTSVRVDVGRFWKIIPSDGFELTDGIASGSLRAVGPITDPDFYGTLVAEDVYGMVDLSPDRIGPGRTYLVFDEKLLSMRETVVPVGAGRARVSGVFVFDRWLPEEFRVRVETLPDRPLRAVYDFGGVAADGLAAGKVEIAGAPGTTRISGGVTVSMMDITLSEGEDGGEPGDDGGDLRVDITVTAGRGVQFLWPTGVIPILQGTAAVGERVRVTHSSAAGEYTVNGTVAIQGGSVFYFDRSFYIREGRIVFAEDQMTFDPRLTVTAEIREVADEGPVRIYLVADERPLSEFTPRWRSEPPLTEAAILTLLGGSVFVGEGGQFIGLSDAVLLGSDVVSQFGIIRGFESTVRTALQLDLFSVRTQLFQNLLRGVIGPTYPLDSQTPSLGRYLDNTTLFLGKYIGSDLFLELLVQLRAGEAQTVAPRSLAGIDVESELSLEWQTPFFRLEWTFFPRDPGSLFLKDHTISFSWEHSY